ncbi:nucleotidyltransferase family protein [Chryseobacterium hagamense]|uniref:Molybdenum cofactor cytidylyltransferase n=1 Tax=Chryseobacterium hagamense TaxID=395935 RepID=A0A511YJN4_9FLAO|nr:nucleotidyltransferase family protein [Chryseobacterium hagamense]GEN75417.1 molybdenum cofactor cytidylyltransferase [Chryseobacterium hagamense]
MEDQTAIIILAAGNSSRLGEPKQLLTYKGKSLLRHTADEASLVTSKVLIVTGEENPEIAEQLTGFHCIPNENWAEGMASSLKTGLQETLQRFPETVQFIFTVCDQPFISASVFKALIEKKNTSPKGIVASAYADTLGVPVLFSSSYLKELFNLNGQEGARKLIQRYRDDTASVPFEQGSWDIDTPEDYQKLINP